MENPNTLDFTDVLRDGKSSNPLTHAEYEKRQGINTLSLFMFECGSHSNGFGLADFIHIPRRHRCLFQGLRGYLLDNTFSLLPYTARQVV